MENRRQLALAGAAAAVVLLATGCGSGTDSARGGTDVRPVGGTAESGGGYGAGSGSGDYGGQPGKGGASSKGAPAKQLEIRDVADVGSVVTDSKGLTLYRFDKDTAKPPKTNCEGDCATTWPAVPADDATASSGIDPSKLGEVARADGSKQLTLAGWPVYRYAKDTAPGDTKGEGVGGTWHALGADGKPAVAGTPAGGSGTPPMGSELSTTDNAKLGEILVDGKWRTLYRFNKDSAWPMRFGCVGACLDTWKPAGPIDKADRADTTKVSGVAAKLVGTVTRPDGTKQLAIDCWPVYTFTGDTKAGDTNGQGKQGLWFAVTKDGKKVGAGSAG